jgi:dolichol-phosphate mannosyltransferase
VFEVAPAGASSGARPRPDTVFFVLPAFDEERSIGDLLGRIDAVMRAAEQPYRVIVVDDGSSDMTACIAEEAAARLPVEVLRNERNLGLGGAVSRGLRHAARFAGDDDAIVTMDADLTQDPCYVPALVEAYRSGADVAIASRFRDDSRVSGVSAFRRVMTLGARVVLGTLIPVHGVRDYSCGFRLYAAPVLRDAYERYGDDFVHERGFACMAEILLKLRRSARFAEVPFQLHYEEKRKVSAMRVWRTAASYFGVVARVRLRESGERRA